jgi:hypothetical protein
MAIIAQKVLFGWEEVDELGDLERLELVLHYLPDEELMVQLERVRGRGRDDYPVRAVWNSILAGVVFQHDSVESLRRELKRNGQLRQLCGFDPFKGDIAVPGSWVYTRFLKRLFRYSEMIDEIFNRLVEELRQCLPEFGRILSVDSKGVDSHARGSKRQAGRKLRDGRAEKDADFGVKTYRGWREDGRLWEKVKSWFGFKIHLVVEAKYELPVGYEVTRASVSDISAAKALLAKTAEGHPELLKDTQKLLGDKAYDDTALISELWDDYEIKPVIDIRNMWKDGEDTRLIEGQRNVVYDFRGAVYCHCPLTDERREMAFGGFEKDRDSLKYRCPASHYGLDCAGFVQCPVAGSVRIGLSEDRRIFTPLARSSYAWERAYRKRTAVERVNSRLDVSFGFERHFIRGLKKMRFRVGLALCVMLALALGRTKQNQSKKMRSLVWSEAA